MKTIITCTSLLINSIILVFPPLHAQDLGKLELIGEPQLVKGEIIADHIDNRDVNGQLTAGLKIISDWDDLHFTSNNGIFNIQQSVGSILLYLSPSERVVSIHRYGFEPYHLVLASAGIKLESGRIWELKLSANKELEYVPARFEISPEGATLIIDGKTHQLNSDILDLKIAEGEHQIIIRKSGYETIEDSLIISGTAVNYFSYKLKKE